MKLKRNNPLFARFFRANSLVSAVVMTLAGVAVQPIVFAADQAYVGPNASKVWNTSATNWDSGVAWTNGNNAIFSGTGESVTVTTVTANGMTFSSAGFTLTGSTITLGAAATPVVITADATISSILAGTGTGISKSGTGVLTLSGVNTYTGATAITAGTVKLGNAAGLGASSLTTVSAGATLDLAGFASARPITFSGTGVSGSSLYNSSTTVQSALTGTLTLAADATIGSALNTTVSGISGTVALGGFTLTVNPGRWVTSNLSAGNIVVTSGAVMQLANGTDTTGNLTINTGGIVDVRDYNTSAQTNAHTLVLNGGLIGNGNALGSGGSGNGGGSTGQTLKNPITVNASGGTLYGNNSAFGGTTNYYLQFVGAISGSGPLTLSGGKGVILAGDVSGYTGSATVSTSLSFNAGASNQSFNGSIAGTGSITQNGTGILTLGGNATSSNAIVVASGTLTLTGVNTASTGTTTVAAGTTLNLNYGTNDSRKIGSGALTLSGATVQLIGGSFADSVASTTLTAGTVSTLTRSSGSATLNLGAVTAGTGAVLNIAQSGIAKTTNANNAGGTLGTWAVIGGTDWGMNDGANNIVSVSGYIPVTRLASGPQTISNGAATNVQIVEGIGAAGPILLGSAVTTINSLNQSASGGTSAATIDPAGQTLVVNSVMIGSGAGALTFGTGTNNGTVKSGGTALGFRDLAGAGITVNSIIADGTGASSLSKDDASSLTLTAANTYTGGTSIVSGSLLLTGAGSIVSTVDLTSSGTSFNLSGISASGTTVGSINGVSGATIVLGTRNLTAGGAANTSFGGIISGSGGSLTKTGTGSLGLSGANTYTGNTVVSGGTLTLGAGTAMGVVQTGSPASQITVASGATVSLNGIAALYGYTIAGTGVGGAGAIVNNSGTAIGTGLGQTTNIKLSASASLGGSGSWCLLTQGYAATTLDLGGNTLTKVGAGTFTLANSTVSAGAISVTGGVLATYSTAPNASAASLNLSNTAGVSLTLGTAMSIGSLAGGGTTGGGIALGSYTLTTGALGTNTSYAGPITGTGALIKVGTGTQTLSGANTYSGSTTISGGTLALDYTTQNNTKLSDTAALIFNGVSGLSLNNGTHTEIVASTTLNAGASVNISRGTGSGILQMKAITRNAGASINFASPGIATTDTLNNTSGILGTWATVGNDYACNSTNVAGGSITAYNGYTDVTRLESGTKVISDGTASNIRITEGTGFTFANITLAAPTININSLFQSTVNGTSAATVALPSQTLRLGVAGGILSASGAGTLTLGASVGQGILTAGGNTTNVAGDIRIVNNGDTLTVNSVIANNGTSVVTLTKGGTGYVVVAGTGTWTGNTTIESGTLEVQAKSGDCTYVVNHGATFRCGYSTGGGGYVNTGLTLYGDGVAATTGFYLLGGKTYNVAGGLTVNDAPTTIRQYGSGLAAMNIFDNNAAGLSISAAASGTVVDSNIQFINGSYGMTVTTVVGANTSSGDLVMNGQLNVTGSGLVKRGAGSLALNGAATTSNAALQLVAGSVITGINNAIGINSALSTIAGAKLVVNGTSQTVASIANAGSVTGGAATLSTLTVSGTAASTSAGTLGGAGANENNLALVKAGTGMLTLTGNASTYAGGSSVNGGTLRVTNTTGSATGSGGVTVNTAGTLDGTGTISVGVTVSATGGTISPGVANAGVLNVGSLTFAGTGSLNVSPGASSVNATASNGLTASGAAGTVSVNIGSTPISAGTYHLISHIGSIQGTGISAFKLGTNPGGAYSYTLQDNAGYLDLQVSTSAIFWSGSASSEWSNNTGVLNWLAGASPSYFATGNQVVFDDTAGNHLVNVSVADVNPGTVQFNNSIYDYTLSGSKAVTGSAGLLKGGTSTLYISNVNSFTGAVTVSQGKLSVNSIADGGSNSALGAGTSIVLSGGTLSYTGSAVSSNRTLSVSTPSTLEVLSGPLTLIGVISGTGTLTKTGTDTLVLGNTGNSIAGLVINQGTVSVDDVAKLGTTTLAMGGGTLALTGSTAISLTQAITLNTGGGTIQVDDTAGVSKAGIFNLSNTLIKTGSGTLKLTSYNGSSANAASDIIINAGTLEFGTGYFNTSPFGYKALDITVNAGGILRVSASHALGGDNVDGGTSLGQIHVLGGTFQVDASQYISAGTVAGQGRLVLDGGTVTGTADLRAVGGTVISSLPSAISSTLAQFGGFSLFYGAATFDVADGTAATDLGISCVISGGNGLTKTGAGTLDLSGVNTYTGNTTVNAGTLHLTNTGRLRFLLGATSGSNNAVTGTGTVIFDGAFVIDTSAASALTLGTWLLDTTATLSATYGTTFSVMHTDGSLWTDAGNGKWTTTVGAKVWTFNKASGTLTLTGNGFAGWAATHAGGGTANQDFDNDGVSNGLEWVLGGSETTNDLGKLPTGTTNAGNLVFTFVRDQQVLTDPGTTVQIEVGANLVDWTETYTVGADTASSSASVGATGTLTVTANTPVAGKDTIRLTVPQAADAKKFARLNVLITP